MSSLRIGYDAKRAFHNTSGLGNYSRDLLRILSTTFKEHRYFLYNPKQEKVHRLRIKTPLQVVHPKATWKYFSSLWRQWGLLFRLKKDKISLFHGLSGELPLRLQVPSVVTIHDLIFVHYPELYNPIDVWIHKRKVKHAAKAASHIIAISEQTKKEVISFCKVPAKKISVVYQGCHPIFKEKCSALMLKKVASKYGLPQKFILSVGTLEKRKNTEIILKAMRHRKEAIVLVGKKTAYVKTLQSYIKAFGMEDRVFLIHKVAFEDLPAFYQMAVLFCYPSLIEGFGIPIVEALCSGVPVITTQGGCFEEAGGKHSFYIDSKNPEMLTSTIECVLLDEALRTKAVKEGYKYIQKFEDAVIAEKVMQCYQSVLR